MCVLYVSVGSKVRTRTFGCVARGRVCTWRSPTRPRRLEMLVGYWSPTGQVEIKLTILWLSEHV